MSDAKTFDPSRYLTKVGSADYLEVKWRLVWLREVHPDARIVTEMVNHDPQAQAAIFRAEVLIPGGGGSASGYGSETARDFREYLEKAETKAVGRALAALGFGTQFCPDFEHGGVVDSPVERSGAAGGTLPDRSRGTTTNTIPGTKPTIQNPDAPASDKQLNFIRSLAKDSGMKIMGPDGEYHTDEPAIAAVAGVDFASDWPKITKQVASEMIEWFQSQRGKNQQQGELIPNGRDYTR